ncbi:radical SAM protein [Oceanospirillum sediminis]|uniref:Radical SAM protein n=1 Tax=Oceanospirillum sediminis TaxID=2760088 RepID=A0A839IRB5_9GAMM|nr:radical SAM protein [Oceanospirillum sediminis]MBB1487461.1 radical SAM protein [Oceanospirillum sediminis]
MFYNDDFPIQYIDPVYRPPSEARSLIIPVTNGCSWNKCSFCEMYTDEQKRFYVRKEHEILEEITKSGQVLQDVNRVFLGDGDAMVLSFRRLKTILLELNNAFPDLKRVSAYCLPGNIKNKTIKELEDLKNLGLSMLYVGFESGDDEVLKRINKGESSLSIFEAMEKIKQAGITSSVMIINGLGGVDMSEQHAVNSAALVNKIQPEYLSSLVLTFHKGPQRFRKEFGTVFQPLNSVQLLHEMHSFIKELNLRKTIYRSDHVSNLLPLKGTLGKDKNRLLSEIELAEKQLGYRSLINLKQI